MKVNVTSEEPIEVSDTNKFYLSFMNADPGVLAITSSILVNDSHQV